MKFSTLKRAAGRLAVCLTAAAALVACGGSDDDHGTPVVTTTSGQVIGKEEATLHAYLGIPYAAPPTGANRWRAPQPPASWAGVRETKSFGNHCPQGATPFGAASVNEDCLYLNVYRPKTGGNHPVMVWIHGGAFYLGLSNQYNPQRLVDQGVVVVTINYRLGALGFMSHAALSAEQGNKSGNYGLMDQQAALRWVQNNIANFGGDRNNVTIFGESAGGFSVHSHLAAPDSAGLFHKAIIMSGAYALDGQQTLADAEATGATVATAAAGILSTATGTAVPACTTAACLRALPVEALLGAQQAAWPSGPIPSVDGRVLPTSVKDSLIAGTYSHVPVIQGSTQDEWRLFTALDEVTPTSVAAPYKGAPLTSENYAEAIAGTFPFLALDPDTIPGLIAHPTLSPYRLSAHGNSASLALSALGTDLLFSCNARVSSKLQEARAAVYAYEFADRTAPSVFPDAAISFDQGAQHTSELAYLFDMPGKTLDATQRVVAATMVGHWTRFARTGNPNTTADPTAWPAFGANDSVLQYNAVGTTLLSDAEFTAAHNCAVWTPTIAEAATTASGAVVGTSSAGMASYLGIPYAAPPVGNLRWAPPAAPTAWTAPRPAVAFSNHCAQGAGLGSPSTSEDCLYLNVFAPTKPGPHPVMVWFHGGAFIGGTAAGYIPTALVAQDTVVVTVNYRLGALGFLAHPALSAEGGGSSGNFGLMDQQQALRWVQANIANFGGDASNVTIFGESAGGASVMAHLASSTTASPAPTSPSTGLFHKAMVLSGAYSAQISLADAYTGWAAVPTRGGCSTTAADADTATCLRNMSVADLLAGQATAYPSGPQPIADGRVLTGAAMDPIRAGTHNRVPVIQGSTRDEWRYFAASSELTSGVPLNATTYPLTVTGLMGSTVANALLPLYPVENYGGSAALAYGALGTDAIFACPGRNASLELQQHTPVYAFEFRDRTAPPPLPTTGVGGPLSFSQGAAHSSELTYLFTLATRGALNAEQQALSGTMVRYTARFARTGDPNGGTDPAWAPFTAASPIYQGFDIASGGGVGPLPATLFSANPANLPEGHFCSPYTPTN